MNHLLKCHSTAEQEAVATWPFRNPLPDHQVVECCEPARSLPLPVLRLSDIIRRFTFAKSRHYQFGSRIGIKQSR